MIIPAAVKAFLLGQCKTTSKYVVTRKSLEFPNRCFYFVHWRRAWQVLYVDRPWYGKPLSRKREGVLFNLGLIK